MHKVSISYYKIAGLGIIFVIALIIRLYPVVESPEVYRNGLGPYGDTHFYHRTAYNLYMGNGFSTTDDGRAYGLKPKEKNLEYKPAITRGPIYSSFMCIVYKVFGSEEDMNSVENWHKNWDKVRITQCVMDAVVCLLVFVIVRLIYPASSIPAFIAAILYCFGFYNIFYTKTLLSESLTTFLVTIVLLFCILALKKSRFWWFLAGGVLGVIVLARPEYVLFVFFLAVVICFANRHSISMAVKNCVIFLIGAIVVISPWTMRNYIVFKEPVLVSAGRLKYNLWLGTFETNKVWYRWGNFPDEIFTSEQEKMQIKQMNRLFDHYVIAGSIKVKEMDAFFFELAMERFKNNPLRCFKNWIVKIPRLWYQSYIQMYRDKEPSGNFFIFYFIFSLYAFWNATTEEKILMAPVLLLFVYLTLVFLPLHVEPRYGVALMPGLICLTGIGICKAISKIKKQFL